MPLIVLPRCLGVTSLRGHASRLGMGRNSLELRVQGERFNATHFDWKSIPQVSVLLIIHFHSSLMHTRAGVAQAILFFCCCIFDTCFASPSKQKDNEVVDSSRLSCQQRTRCGFQWHSLHSASNPWGFRSSIRKSSAPHSFSLQDLTL